MYKYANNCTCNLKWRVAIYLDVDDDIRNDDEHQINNRKIPKELFNLRLKVTNTQTNTPKNYIVNLINGRTHLIPANAVYLYDPY